MSGRKNSVGGGGPGGLDSATTGPVAAPAPTTTAAGASSPAAPPTAPGQQTPQFTPRPPPKKDSGLAGTGSPGSSTNLPALSSSGSSSAASSSSASSTTTPSKPSSVGRLPPSQRKQQHMRTDETNGGASAAGGSTAAPPASASIVPLSPSSGNRERMATMFPSPLPNTPNSTTMFSSPAPHTPQANNNNTFATAYPMHSPSPLGSAYDEVRIPTELPLFVASPSSGANGLLHPQATSPTESTSPASLITQPNGTTPSLPSAHAVVPLPLSFHYSSATHGAASSAAANAVVNLPNILIPPTPSMPSPVLWVQQEPSVQGAAHAVVAIPSSQTNDVAGPSPVLSAANQSASPFGTVPPSASSPSPSPAPLTSMSSMDSRQWASLLLKYRAGESSSGSTAVATPSSRANPAANVHANQTSTAAATASAGVSPQTGGSVVSPVYSPNALGGARPLSRARSRQGGARQPSIIGSVTNGATMEEDPEKLAMQNELHRLRAVIAMQTHAATSPALHTSPSPFTLASANPAPLPSPQPQHTPVACSGPSGGAGLSWNTAFNALSSNSSFWQGQASPSPGPVMAPSPAMSVGTPGLNGADPSAHPPFTCLPPAVDPSTTTIDHRSTFRSMSMLIRTGTVAHAQVSHHTATATPNGFGSGSSSSALQAAPGLLVRSRSAEEPNQMQHHHAHQQSNGFAPSSRSTAYQSMQTQQQQQQQHHEIEEDLTSSPVESSTGAPSFTGRSVFAMQREAFSEPSHPQSREAEIEEESHLRPAADAPQQESEAPAETSTEEPSHHARSNARTASAATTLATSVTIPLFLPPSVYHHSGTPKTASLRSPRSQAQAFASSLATTPCTSDACMQRAQRDKVEIQRLSEDLSSLKARSTAELKAAHTRYKRELGQKDARVAQLEKLQTKLLQPHSKLVAQVEDLTQVVQRLRDQLVSLGVSPVAGTAALNLAREAEQKQATHATPPQQHHHLQHGREETSPTRSILSSSSQAADAASGPDGREEVSPQSGSRDSPFTSHRNGLVMQGDPPSLSQRSVLPVGAEPFFNTSAPRTVTSKSRRRSRSFSSVQPAPSTSVSAAAANSSAIGSANKMRDSRQQAKERMEKESASIDGTAVALSNSNLHNSSNGSHSPRGSPITIAPSRPPQGALGFGVASSRPRKSSITKSTVAAQAMSNAAAAQEPPAGGPIIATAAPVAARPQRQQSRGRAFSHAAASTSN